MFFSFKTSKFILFHFFIRASLFFIIFIFPWNPKYGAAESSLGTPDIDPLKIFRRKSFDQNLLKIFSSKIFTRFSEEIQRRSSEE